METAELLVQVTQSGGDARNMAVAFVRRLGEVDCQAQRARKRRRAALDLPRRRQIEQPLLGGLDLLFRLSIEIEGEGAVHHVFAKGDDLPAEMEIEYGLGVIERVDDGNHRSSEPRQVLGAADLGQR